ncbi:MAG: iron-containing alcohol dehydrogenase [Proteobacteria bacterium]|nr:iron-containing alcohol dehydrogenase [Pseudomonadota bacterium]
MLFRTTPRIVMGAGCVSTVGAEARQLGVRRVLVVTDRGLVEAGLLERLETSLKRARVGFSVFDGVEPDPRHEIVDRCREALQAAKARAVIGLGGGSSIDIAKMAAVMAVNPGQAADYFGVDTIPRPGLPTIMVPTTAGTGSEVTSIVILSDEGEKLKKGVVSPYLMPAAAVLDPELTLGLPPAVTAATGMDALIHAIEAYTSVNATGLTDLLAARAMELIGEHIRAAWARGSNLAARSAMLEGSLLAGMAFANAGVTAVHAFAYPIGAEFHIPHGLANAIMLPPVMAFNMPGDLDRFARVAELLGEETAGLSARQAAEAGVEAVRQLGRDLELPQSLGEFGVKKKDVPGLAKGVMKVTRLLANNPRTLTEAQARDIYMQAL